MLPWWSIYVTYTVLFLLNVTLAFYIMLYGLSLGYETSLEWFLAFFAGFFINVFFTMPAKVVAMATILVVFFEYRMTMKDQSPLKKLAEGMKLLEKERGARKGTHGKLYRKRRRMHPEPLSTEEAKQVLERLHIEKEAKEMMRDLILYTLFTITVLGIISAHVQVEAQYQQGVNVEAELLGVIGSGKDDSDDRDSLSKVHSVETLWRYLVDVVTPRLVPEVDAITSHISRSYFLMTHARLRQVRIGLNATDDCLQNIPRAVWPRDNKFACVSSLWGDEPEETRHFNHSWKTPYWQNGSNLLDSAHRYWSEQELDTEAFVGEHGIYSGGGYVVTFLREDPEAVQSSLKKLHLNDWIDRLTKCVFLEFTVYNPNAEMYTQVVLAFEVDKAGAVYTTKSVHTAILSSKNRRNTTWIRMAEAAAAVCVLFYLFKAINEILHTSLGMYFSNTWNWIELLVTVASFLCMVFYLFRLTTYLTVMQRFEIFGHGFFLDFTQVFYWQRVFHVNLAIFGALVILKLVKITAFNPFTKVFVRTMLIGQKDFVGHMFSTIIIMFAFASLGRLLFGCASLSYSTMDRALVTLLFFILGESDYPVFVTINEYIGNFFFFTFLVVSQYLLINLFIAILRDSMELSRYKPYTREEAIVRYMIDATMLYFNLTARNRQRDDVKSPFSA